MECPDCKKTIGRFAAKTDDNGSGLASVSCPRSGRKILLESAPEPQRTSGRKQWKNKKSRRTEIIHVS